MSDKLAEIIAWKHEEIKHLEGQEEKLRKAALLRNDFRGFKSVLHQPGVPTLIAEVKKASPSAGVIAEDFNPVQRAVDYELAGADALSVLTDEKYFQGSLRFIAAIREQVQLPILRKDFIVSPLQVYESVITGADAILLIVAALDDKTLRECHELAQSLQLDVLVEVHDMPEMDRALDLGAGIIGINNRNLKTFEVDLQTTIELGPEIPADCLGVSESGIKTPDDVAFIRKEGIDCFLIGETLMRSNNLQQGVNELLGR
jgi:indole-3-glycerol phosphate synthase